MSHDVERIKYDTDGTVEEDVDDLRVDDTIFSEDFTLEDLRKFGNVTPLGEF